MWLCNLFWRKFLLWLGYRACIGALCGGWKLCGGSVAGISSVVSAETFGSVGVSNEDDDLSVIYFGLHVSIQLVSVC